MAKRHYCACPDWPRVGEYCAGRTIYLTQHVSGCPECRTLWWWGTDPRPVQGKKGRMVWLPWFEDKWVALAVAAELSRELERRMGITI